MAMYQNRSCRSNLGLDPPGDVVQFLNGYLAVCRKLAEVKDGMRMMENGRSGDYGRELLGVLLCSPPLIDTLDEHALKEDQSGGLVQMELVSLEGGFPRVIVSRRKRRARVT